MKKETQAIIDQFTKLKEGVTVGVDVKSSNGDRVEIRKDGCLMWRSFEFEDGFELMLKQNLEYASK